MSHLWSLENYLLSSSLRQSLRAAVLRIHLTFSPQPAQSSMQRHTGEISVSFCLTPIPSSTSIITCFHFLKPLLLYAVFPVGREAMVKVKIMVVTTVIYSSEPPAHRFTEHPMTSSFYPFLCLPDSRYLNVLLKIGLSLTSSSPAEGDVETKIRVQVVYLREDCRKHW